MSHTKAISALALFLSVFFSTISVSLIILKITIGFKSILEQGISKEASVSLWIMIPILTLLGIIFIRYAFGFAHNFDHSHGVPGSLLFLLTSSVVSLQIMFGLLGYFTMKNLNYFDEFIHEDIKSVTSYVIVCPGVAFVVFGFFFIHYALVTNQRLITHDFLLHFGCLRIILMHIKKISVLYFLWKIVPSWLLILPFRRWILPCLQ